MFASSSIHVITVHKEKRKLSTQASFFFLPPGCRALVFDNNHHLRLQVHSITQPRCGKHEKFNAKHSVLSSSCFPFFCTRVKSYWPSLVNGEALPKAKMPNGIVNRLKRPVTGIQLAT